MTTNEKVMKKIHLQLLAGSAADSYSLTSSSVPFVFIYGTDSGGLTPFELSLADTAPGSSLKLQLSAREIESFFGKLFSSVRESIGLLIVPETLYLNITLVKCSEPEAREVVQAMAKTVGHGNCGGSCGCGCG